MIDTSFSKVWIDDDGICRVILLPGVVVGPAEMKENLASQRKLIGNGKAPVLVDMRDIKNSTQEARNFAASEEYAQILAAAAFLENSFIGKILGNLFINFSKPLYPTKLFNSEEEAIAWLKGFLPALDSSLTHSKDKSNGNY